ncbi:MAG: tRNA-guanine transglycosylase [Candidatus Hydrothermarchaeales archaeon]
MLLEILKHHGPARLGKLEHEGCEIATPNFFSIIARDVALDHDIYIVSHDVKTSRKPLIYNYGSLKTKKDIGAFGILPDDGAALKVPKEIAEFSVESTLKFAEKYPGYGAVIQGSKYPALRMKCARALKEHPLLVIADAGELLENPRLLVEIVTGIREVIPPNTALYFPFASPHMFYLLAYMGVDLFDSGDCILKARRNEIITTRGHLYLKDLKELPCTCSVCRDRSPEELVEDFNAVLKHNFDLSVCVVREIREAIRKGILRELVEEKAAGGTLAMTMLRLLDQEKQDFLERYTPVVP